jgi:hypothetical protein
VAHYNLGTIQDIKATRKAPPPPPLLLPPSASLTPPALVSASSPFFPAPPPLLQTPHTDFSSSSSSSSSSSAAAAAAAAVSTYSVHEPSLSAHTPPGSSGSESDSFKYMLHEFDVAAKVAHRLSDAERERFQGTALTRIVVRLMQAWNIDLVQRVPHRCISAQALATASQLVLSLQLYRLPARFEAHANMACADYYYRAGDARKACACALIAEARAIRASLRAEHRFAQDRLLVLTRAHLQRLQLHLRLRLRMRTATNTAATHHTPLAHTSTQPLASDAKWMHTAASASTSASSSASASVKSSHTLTASASAMTSGSTGLGSAGSATTSATRAVQALRAAQLQATSSFRAVTRSLGRALTLVLAVAVVAVAPAHTRTYTSKQMHYSRG